MQNQEARNGFASDLRKALLEQFDGMYRGRCDKEVPPEQRRPCVLFSFGTCVMITPQLLADCGPNKAQFSYELPAHCFESHSDMEKTTSDNERYERLKTHQLATDANRRAVYEAALFYLAASGYPQPGTELSDRAIGRY